MKNTHTDRAREHLLQLNNINRNILCAIVILGGCIQIQKQRLRRFIQSKHNK